METGDADSIFVDTNVLVYAAISSAPRHTEARRELERLHAEGPSLWVSRQVLREYAAVLTRPQSFTAPLPSGTVAADVRRLSTEFSIAEDSPQVTEQLVRLLEQLEVGGKQVHDANIVATMLASGVRRLLTANPDDFDRFDHLISIIELPNAASTAGSAPALPQGD